MTLDRPSRATARQQRRTGMASLKPHPQAVLNRAPATSQQLLMDPQPQPPQAQMDRDAAPKLHLDLYNFDSPAAEGSRYVLTSPRSLEACARCGVKPVELLPRPLSDFAREAPGRSMRVATGLFEVYEKDRHAKLRQCREERERVVREEKRRILQANADGGSGVTSSGSTQPLTSNAVTSSSGQEAGTSSGAAASKASKAPSHVINTAPKCGPAKSPQSSKPGSTPAVLSKVVFQGASKPPSSQHLKPTRLLSSGPPAGRQEGIRGQILKHFSQIRTQSPVLPQSQLHVNVIRDQVWGAAERRDGRPVLPAQRPSGTEGERKEPFHGILAEEDGSHLLLQLCHEYHDLHIVRVGRLLFLQLGRRPRPLEQNVQPPSVRHGHFQLADRPQLQPGRSEPLSSDHAEGGAHREGGEAPRLEGRVRARPQDRRPDAGQVPRRRPDESDPLRGSPSLGQRAQNGGATARAGEQGEAAQHDGVPAGVAHTGVPPTAATQPPGANVGGRQDASGRGERGAVEGAVRAAGAQPSAEATAGSSGGEAQESSPRTEPEGPGGGEGSHAGAGEAPLERKAHHGRAEKTREGAPGAGGPTRPEQG
ncbi:hypothetical protein fugu_017113 [Takifugu bimaculatus]|uniref:Uncharacterized protein n=1 Tax=Takifugu bimaculatus TaxID=433685 RepID=A0A4Z2BXB3_9TELE|nr:hypothetical protein fugu_017113 [Takifugu bimaculatus]